MWLTLWVPELCKVIRGRHMASSQAGKRLSKAKGPQWKSMGSCPPVDIKLRSPYCFYGCNHMCQRWRHCIHRYSKRFRVWKIPLLRVPSKYIFHVFHFWVKYVKKRSFDKNSYQLTLREFQNAPATHSQTWPELSSCMVIRSIECKKVILRQIWNKVRFFHWLTWAPSAARWSN